MASTDLLGLEYVLQRVHLNVSVDGRKYRQLLEVWANDTAWDWGEEKSIRGLLKKDGRLSASTGPS